MAKAKILIVEDEKSIQTAFKQIISNEGYDVISANNGLEGLVLALEEHPDLILMDVLMPQLDGETALKQLREDPWGKTAKVIVLSNFDSAATVSESLAHGVTQHLIKADTSGANLVSIIKTTLEKK